MKLPALLLLLACAPLQAVEKPEVLTTGEGLRFGIWPKKPAQPAPTLIVLSGKLEETLSSAYFRQSGDFLAKEGVLLVSVDLPCHGAEVRKGEPAGIAGWRTRLVAGEDVMADLAARLRKVLDHVIKTGMADPERIAALGTSRGGFSALHFAATEPRVKSVMAFAPVADLANLREFKGAEDHPMVKKVALNHLADALAGRAVWVVIGDRDDRVNTDSIITFARTATHAALAKKVSPLVDLHVIAEPKGHTVPAGYAEIGANWLRPKLVKK